MIDRHKYLSVCLSVHPAVYGCVQHADGVQCPSRRPDYPRDQKLARNNHTGTFGLIPDDFCKRKVSQFFVSRRLVQS